MDFVFINGAKVGNDHEEHLCTARAKPEMTDNEQLTCEFVVIC